MADGTSTAGAAKEGAVGMLSPRSAAGCAALMLCGMRPVLSALIFSSRVTFSPRVFRVQGQSKFVVHAGSAGGSGGGGGGVSGSDAAAPRGSYWKRSDSMRLVHLLVEPDLKPLFLDQNNSKQIRHQAALRFHDDNGWCVGTDHAASISPARRVISLERACQLLHCRPCLSWHQS